MSTNTPTATPTNTPTNTPTTTPTVNYCRHVFRAAYWQNYDIHYSDREFYALLKSTVDFGSTFAAESGTAAIALAIDILSLPGNHVVRNLLSAELNVAAAPTLGLQSYSTYAGTINQLLTTVYNDNGTGNSSPYTNGAGLTSQDRAVLGFLGTDQTATSPCPIN